MNIFERAARASLRFASPVGLLTCEQLFDLPLKARSSSRPDLDGVAKAVAAQLREASVESFVDDASDPRRAELELALEIVKHVIASKKTAAQAAERAAETLERKRKLLAALAARQDAELAGMTRAEIEAEIAKLDGGA